MEKKFLEVAKEAALQAGEIISKYFGKEHQYKFKNKDQSDFATQADLESEQKIIQILTKNFPETNIIAEESGKGQKGSEYTWVIDPLDGTISFTKGMYYFAVSIGLLKESRPILGVIYHVLANELYFAQKGKGTYLNGKPIHITQQNDLSAAAIAMDSGHKKRRPPKINLYVLPLLREAGYIYSLGSAVMCMGLVGKGVLDGMIAQAFIWDLTAGTVIIREAGGKVTDFEGKEPDWSQERLNIVASNGLIHDQILEALKQ